MKIFVIAVSFVFFSLSAIGQTIVNLDASTHNSTQTGCAYWFYDDGTSSGNYTNSQDRWITFASSDAVNTHMKASFASFDIDPSDTLFIYDGPTTASPLIGAYNDNNPLSGSVTMVQASIANVSGDLTFRFKTNGTTVAAGWDCSVGCIPQCQDVLAAVDTLQMFPLPNDSNYVDICFGDIVTFAAMGAGPGVFPENDLLYHQDSSTTLFIWDFGDGTVDTGRVIDHLYNSVMGYDVFLNVIDTRGCTNTQLLALRVRVSGNPIIDIKPLPDICAGESIDLVVGENATSTIVVAPTGSFQIATELYDSTTFIPDGPYCSTNCYYTPVTFSTFPPGSTITSASDIASICINMEHTFTGDLAFSIICPNGTTVQMDSYDHSGGADLGISNSTTYDDCDPAQNPPGTGWTYCWSEVYPQQGTLNTLDAGTSPIPATDTINNTGYITTETPFLALVGCPLNGTWSIEICDEWGLDNGYVFWWSLTLLNQTQSGAWSYTVPIDSVSWAGPYITATSDSTAFIAPIAAGTYTYTATVWDVFGCSYDTTLSVEVLANPTPDLGPDTTACEGTAISLNAGTGTQYFWSNGAITQTINPDVSGIYAITVTNSNGNVACYGSDTIEVNMIPWASVNLGPDLCETESATLDAQNPGFDYHWSNGSSAQTIDVSSTGTYSVTVSYGGASECSDVDTISVNIIPTPVVNLGPDQEMCRHEFRDYDVSQTSPQYTYLWSTGSLSPYLHVEGLPVGSVSYSVTVSGCDSRSDTVLVDVIACDLTIPNIITPNGDGYNDVFAVENLPFYPNSVLMIFNRWGKKIYETANYLNDWDGEKFADGTYFMVLKVNYGNEEYEDHHGTLTIMRD
ncbi:MAG: hypothetical protein A2W93_08205 [Bacteroidetes bacterium GWF2_43_63]|nr:MAG: hypothetical protein A2W94_04860 [Bacteroidetes bacterium GWE2_42_42]OFY55594.1 MAG: hypothetical protein A2W93_08205 [Bacteroidetes bacterium GWF2_43_63]HBG71610.1 hypothetical protein [Bacteroidales bacterium]HCB62143.1 hypothetical protein [Bacteroidales bacterium]HCY22371.1 hypothetical protein [Bacteroidales bacterium]